MYGFRCTDSRHIAVALVGEHHIFGPKSAYGSGNGRSSSMGCLYPVDVNIVICKYRTPYRGYPDGAFRQSHLMDHFGKQLVYDTVATSRAVMHVHIVKELRCAVHLILFLNYILNFHWFQSYSCRARE